MSRNFRLGSRDMGKAGYYALDRERKAGQISYSTVATNSQRFNDFCDYAKSVGINKMENVTHDILRGYADHLKNENLSTSTIQNRISSVNSVMSAATGGRWTALTAVHDLNVKRRTRVRTQVADGMNRTGVEDAAKCLRTAGLENAAGVIELARDLGLRCKEASLLPLSHAVLQAEKFGHVTINYGTKGHQARQVPVSGKALERLRLLAAGCPEICLVPDMQTYRQFVDSELREARSVLKIHKISRPHELRAAYAQERYEQLIEQGVAEKNARMVVSEELGHHRIDVVSSYIVRDRL
ncbi:MAG: tyrosine-type recombinase/integrase [Pseudomonadales bacterium]|nr:tyrosine-type recombinase/integrase [Pseudomonadales bacterium]